jgi:hypothetical protein
MSGFELDDVHVGLRAGIRAPLKYVVPLHECRAPWPRPGKHHFVAARVSRVLNVDAFSGKEVRGEYHARRDDVVDVRGVVEIRVDDIVAEHEGEPVERLDFVAAGYGK